MSARRKRYKRRHPSTDEDSDESHVICFKKKKQNTRNISEFQYKTQTNLKHLPTCSIIDNEINTYITQETSMTKPKYTNNIDYSSSQSNICKKCQTKDFQIKLLQLQLEQQNKFEQQKKPNEWNNSSVEKDIHKTQLIEKQSKMINDMEINIETLTGQLKDICTEYNTINSPYDDLSQSYVT
jgi:hypothetical protein